MQKVADTNPHLPDQHPPVTYGKVGVLIVNLGTPDSTGWWDLRRYLKEFLSDRRVIEVNPVVWKLVLNLVILTFRPGKAAHAYKKIWRQATDESPLRFYTRAQGEKLHALLNAEHDNLVVDWAMRYGNPSIHSRMEALQAQGCERIVVLPLYPQYSATTTATVCDEVFRSLMTMRRQPTLRIADPYEAHPLYIEALARSVQQHLAQLDWEPDTILASFHSLPREYFDKGDPYYCYCHKTTRLLREELRKTTGDDADKLQLTFQSRFGPKEWLQPYTDKTLEKLAQEGIKKVAVVCPGFAADCVETLEEIDIAARATFFEHGGSHFTSVPCLNDSDDHIKLLADISRTTAGSWLA
jgi:ferrochelatase